MDQSNVDNKGVSSAPGLSSTIILLPSPRKRVTCKHIDIAREYWKDTKYNHVIRPVYRPKVVMPLRNIKLDSRKKHENTDTNMVQHQPKKMKTVDENDIPKASCRHKKNDREPGEIMCFFSNFQKKAKKPTMKVEKAAKVKKERKPRLTKKMKRDKSAKNTQVEASRTTVDPSMAVLNVEQETELQENLPWK